MKLTLKAVRTNYGLTQKQAASLVGVSPKTWFSYEHGNVSPRNNVVRRIGKLFNIDPNGIIFSPYIALKSVVSKKE